LKLLVANYIEVYVAFEASLSMRSWSATAFLAVLIAGFLTQASASDEIKPAGRRIVGGERTDIREHPWQVALNVRIDGAIYLCGGSIIGERWVLTAAHCFKKSTKPGEVRVKAGATNYLTDGIWSDVQKIVIHERYDSNTHEHDIALIKLKSTPQGRVIPLIEPSLAVQAGQPLEVTGWGATSEEGDTSRVLLKATVPYADNAACNVRTAYDGRIKPGMLCAGYRDGGIDSCQGDSGGPLVWHTADGPVLVGVVSWGEGCARKLAYGVYTRVTSYVTWVSNVVGREPN
jgi:trypsin